MTRSFRFLICVPFAAILLVSSVPLAADALQARWQPQQVKFHFSAFDVFYTCDGIRSKVRRLLRHFGAHHEVRVAGSCGGDRHRPQPFFNMFLAFSTPSPVASGDQVPGETFEAEYQELQVGYNKPRFLDYGDCELVEQFRREVLPFFEADGYETGLKCLPGHRSLSGIAVNANVLRPLDVAAANEILPAPLPDGLD